MPTKKSKGRKRTTRRKHKQSVWDRLRTYIPGWAFWVGALCVVMLCLFMWRAFTSVKDDDFVAYPEGFTVYGIDVSRYQTDINWELVCNKARINNEPVSFAFIKATEGADKVDPKYAYNDRETRKYNIPRAAYHFYSFKSTPKQQADFFIKHVQLKEGDLPPVLDVERRPDGITPEAFKWSVLEWLSLIEKHYGVKPILYTYYSFRMQYLNDVIFDQYPYWIAHYGVDEVAYKGPWTFWQFSDKGELPGIKGHVDLNVFNGTLGDLMELSFREVKE